jgi:hypothetical protein
MKFRTLASTIAAIAGLTLLVGCAETRREMGAAAENDNNVLTGGPMTGTTLKDLPQSVRQTLKQRAATAEIADIDKQDRNGQVVYKISFAEPGRNPTLYVRQDGKVLSDLDRK